MEILGLIIIALVWFFKAMTEREDSKGGTKKDPDGFGKAAIDSLPVSEAARAGLHGVRSGVNRALDGLDAKRAQEHEGAKRRPGGKRPSPTEIKEFHEQRRADEWERSEQRHAAERASSEKRWAAARKQQADAALVHGVHIDSCEGRLESLKVLYDAGILDREEYAQRVARVRRQHTQSGSY